MENGTKILVGFKTNVPIAHRHQNAYIPEYLFLKETQYCRNTMKLADATRQHSSATDLTRCLNTAYLQEHYSPNAEVPDYLSGDKKQQSVFLSMVGSSVSKPFTHPVKNDTDGQSDSPIYEEGRGKVMYASLFAYYTFSVMTGFYNKYTIGTSSMGFPYPLMSAALQNMLHLAFSGLIIKIMDDRSEKNLRDSGQGQIIDDVHGVRSGGTKNYFLKILPCGLAAGLDIGLSNTSLRYVTLSLYTIIKSSSPIFAFMVSVLFRLEKPRPKLIGIMAVIALGVLLMTFPPENNQFIMSHIGGVVIVLIASALSGVRWTLSQVLLVEKEELSKKTFSSCGSRLEHIAYNKRELGINNAFSYYKNMHNPLMTVFQITPIIGLTCLVMSLVVEDWESIPNSPFFNTAQNCIDTLLIVAMGSVITFGLIISEFIFVTITSIATLSISGIFKEILVILSSVLVFGDLLRWYNYIGLAVSITGIALYHKYRYESNSKEAASGHSTIQVGIYKAQDYPAKSFPQHTDLKHHSTNSLVIENTSVLDSMMSLNNAQMVI